MNLTQSVKTCLFKRFARFSGRASRSEFLYYSLFVWLVIAGFFFLSLCAAINLYLDVFWDLLILLANVLLWLLLFIPYVAVHVRRLHDVGYPAWPVFLVVIFVFCIACSFIENTIGHIFSTERETVTVMLVVFGVLRLLLFSRLCFKGQEGANQYGGDPLGDGLELEDDSAKHGSSPADMGGDVVI